MDKEIREEMKELISQINKANYNYYVLDNPTISDKEYDGLYDRLVKLEKVSNIVLSSSPTNKVGGNPLEKFEKITHKKRLMSLDKAQNYQEIEEWEDRNQKIKRHKPEFTVEHKFDGLSLALTYVNGKLTIGATRGNGDVGENVTAQVKTIRTVPLTIKYKGYVVIQGEGIMKLSELEKYNQKAEEKLKNARNAAAGAIRNLDPKVTKSRNLDFFAYNVNYIEGLSFSTQEEEHQFLIDNGFMVDPLFKVEYGFDGVKQLIEKVDKEKEKYDFLIDGMVVKLNNLSIRQELGETLRFPRGMLAYKFEAVEMTTVLNDVIWQVSRTGKLTPVAVLEPVEIAGVTVSRATLNNYDDILRKKVKIGAKVFVRRSNEVIPEVLGLAEDLDGSMSVEKPKVCPECGAKLEYGNIEITCPNHNDCPKQIIEKLTFFVSKHAMNIEFLSSKTISKLYSNFGINRYADLYKLSADDLYKLDNFKDKKVNKLLEKIEKSKTPELTEFIYALGIDNVGKKTAKQLAKAYRTFENFQNATVEELVAMPDIAQITAQGIVDFFADEYNKEELNLLWDVGVKVLPKQQNKDNYNEFFAGKKFVLTGTLKSLTRDEAIKKIEKVGGEVTSSVSKNTAYVIVGEDAGSKETKARALNIPILNEQEFLEKF